MTVTVTVLFMFHVLFFRLDADSQDKKSRARLGTSIFIFLFVLPTSFSQNTLKITYVSTCVCILGSFDKDYLKECICRNNVLQWRLLHHKTVKFLDFS